MAFAMKFFTCLVLGVCIVASVDADIPCFEVGAIISPCQAYLTGSGGDVPTACCDSVRQLNNMAQSTPDRQQTCRCLKSLAQNIPGLNLSLAAGLPKKCSVFIPYAISFKTDCNKLHNFSLEENLYGKPS